MIVKTWPFADRTGFGGGGFGQTQQPAPAAGGLFGGNTGQTSTFGGGGELPWMFASWYTGLN